VSGEEFMKNLSWLSNLKLRLSYGQTGNDNVSAYQTRGSISGAKYYTFGSSESIGYVPNNLRNLDLGWERTTEYNVGLDFGFLNNRISGSVEYYNRLTEDLIMNKTIPVTTGYSSVKANVGSVRNEGFEVNINSDNIRTKNFSWRTSLNFAYNKNKIVDLQYKENLISRGSSLAGMSGDYSNLWIIGQPIDINYNLITVGVWQLDEAEEAAKYGCKPGQYKPLDLNEDGVIDDKDRVIDGKRTPDWTGGMTNTFTYKEFDLSFQAAFQAGARARNQFYVSYALENNNLNFNNLRKNYWTPENPTNASAQPSNMGTYRSKAGSWGNAKSEMSHTMFSSNFLKISYITLGYTFKPSVLEKMKLGNLRLYATVQNPFILCAKDVVDPEQLNVSINTSDAMTRNVIFGINLSFK
jgi:TonB-dependent starch-binding outer membrane protein SusC